MTRASMEVIALFEQYQAELRRELHRAKSLGYRLREVTQTGEQDETDERRVWLLGRIEQYQQAIDIMKAD